MSKVKTYAWWYGELRQEYADLTQRDLVDDYPSEVAASYPFVQEYLDHMNCINLAKDLAYTTQEVQNVYRFG